MEAPSALVLPVSAENQQRRLCSHCQFSQGSLTCLITESSPWGSESMHTSLHAHYGLAAIFAIALVVIPWLLVGWLIWALT